MHARTENLSSRARQFQPRDRHPFVSELKSRHLFAPFPCFTVMRDGAACKGQRHFVSEVSPSRQVCLLSDGGRTRRRGRRRHQLETIAFSAAPKNHIPPVVLYFSLPFVNVCLPIIVMAYRSGRLVRIPAGFVLPGYNSRGQGGRVDGEK